LLGACFDPFALEAPPDDPRFDPIYDACSKLGVPAIVTLGGWPGIPAPLRLSSPLAIDAVAKRFPDLIIIASHAGWPFVIEMIAVAWRCENVFFENSFYHFAAGAGALVDAANSMIADKMLYASAYPFAPIGETLEQFRALPFKTDVAEKVLHINADKLLRRIANNRAAASVGSHQ
jgi:predicted TIM-barrel fold metal-dependent hydrolase